MSMENNKNSLLGAIRRLKPAVLRSSLNREFLELKTVGLKSGVLNPPVFNKRKKKEGMILVILLLVLIPSIYAFSIDNYINNSNYFSNYSEISAIIKLKNSTKESLKDKIKEMKAMQFETLAVLDSNFKKKQQLTMINVISGNITREGIEMMRNNSDVEEIYPNTEFSIMPFYEEQNFSIKLDVSRVAIGANYSNYVLNLTGKNITVAVIDTGIEYTHTAFGNCTLTNVTQGTCRIKGGYDFVNSDNDPMDDHSHGTHVAGTVGGNGTVVGIAPESNFYALKVCNSGGSCATADIAAGIDWAIGNNANIITISLGSTAVPNLDDGVGLLEQIVDDAVNLGIVVTVAAGNDGSATSIISSPGSAKKVITVGASNDAGTFDTSDDAVASFSSRGPSAFGRLDPDLSAPGVSINAPVLSNSYGLKSGTSMATPHVAGAAALLLEYNRNLTPKQVRSRLMHASTSIPGSLFEKGSGMINITKAVLTSVEADINGTDRWEFSTLPNQTISTFITLYSNNSAQLSFNFSLEEIRDNENTTFLNASSFSFSPENPVVNSNSNLSVKLTFTAPADANASVYGTTIIITANNSENLRIPAVITIPVLDGGAIFGKVNNNNDYIYYKFKAINSTSSRINLSWNDSANNLELYAFNPSGIRIGTSTSSSNSEQIVLTNLTYDEYWILIRAASISGTVYYNVSATYNSTIGISPLIYQNRLSNELTNMTFALTNDNIQKNNLTASARVIKQGQTFTFNNASLGAGKNNTVLFKKDLGIDLNETRFLTINATWLNTTNDIDLHIVFWNDNGDGTANSSEIFDTRFTSQHYSNYENKSVESLDYADIKYYIKTYTDVGFEIKNWNYTNSENATVNGIFYNESPWEKASVAPAMFNLTTGESKNITVTINTTGLAKNQTYDFSFVVQNSTNVLIDTTARITLNTAPNITSFQPNSSSFNMTENSSVQLNHSSADVDGDSLSYIWHVNGFLNSTTQNFTYTANFTSAGSLNITIIVSDGLLNDSHTWIVNVANVNRIPNATNVSIMPANAGKISNITCNYTYSDPDNDIENRSVIRWRLNSSVNTSFENSTIIYSANLTKNQIWGCEVVPNDGTNFGAPVNSSNATIQNSPPIAVNATISPSAVFKSTNNVGCNASYSDLDGDSESNSIIRWYINGNFFINSSNINNSNYNKTTILMCEYLPSDGFSIGQGANSTNATVLNSPPSIKGIANTTRNSIGINITNATISTFEINETDVLRFLINATDDDNDSGIYAINSSLFTVQNNTFIWQTNETDSGHYTFRINVSDGANISSIVVAVNVSNLPLLGNISNISTNLNNISMVVDNSTSLENFTNQKTVEFRQANFTVVRFVFNFTAAVLNFSRIKIEKQANTSAVGSLVVRGLTLFGDQRKTVYLDNIANKSSVCIKDADIINVSQISSACNGANEYFVACNSTITSGYNCTVNGSKYIVMNLSNSGIIEYSPFCGDGACNSDETCSSCSADCGACVVPSSGGGGGGVVSGVPNATKNITQNISQITEKIQMTNFTSTIKKEEPVKEIEKTIPEAESPKVVPMAVKEINQTGMIRKRMSLLTLIILVLILAAIVWAYIYFRKITSAD